MRSFAMRLPLLISLVSLLASRALAQPLEVVLLNTQTFEHQTQAGTGQTTGHWCVLFVNSSNSDSKLQVVAEDAWEQLAADEDKQTIFAQVDVAASGPVGSRFSISSTPAAILFRDRAMYPLPLDTTALRDADKLVAAVQAFINSGYDDQEALAVPDEPTTLSAVKDFLSYLEIEPSITLYVGIGLMATGLLLFLGFLIAATYMALPPKPAAAAAGGGSTADQKNDKATAPDAGGAATAGADRGNSSSSDDDDAGDAVGDDGQGTKSTRVRRRA